MRVGGVGVLEFEIVTLGSTKEDCDTWEDVGIVWDDVEGRAGRVWAGARRCRGGIKGAGREVGGSVGDDAAAKGNQSSWNTTSLEMYMQPDSMIAFVAFLIRTIAEEDTYVETERKFMWIIGTKVRKTCIPKDLEECVIKCAVKWFFKRRLIFQ